MSAHFPDVETVRSALSLATRAPSVHNSQPWQWRVGEHSLHLYSDPELHLPHTDPDARDMLLSCGAALNHCVVAFAALGWQSKVHRFPNPSDAHHWRSLEPIGIRLMMGIHLGGCDSAASHRSAVLQFLAGAAGRPSP